MPTDSRLWALAHANANATAYGDMDWSPINASWRARVEVAAEHFDSGEVFLEMIVKPGRPDEPTVSLVALDICCRRVDVNGTHRDGDKPRRQTHLQGEPPPNFVQWLEPNEFPVVAAAGTVDGRTYEHVFGAAAKLMGVDVSSVVWQDPPEGRP